MHVLIDGDNIQYETFLTHVKGTIDRQFGQNYVPTIFCQTNIVIKYRSMKDANIKICCTKTTNKNASDAQIILRVGKILGGHDSGTIVIVSNDKIFEEIADGTRVHLVGFVNPTRCTRLRKNTIKAAFRDLSAQRCHESEDIYLTDLYEALNCNSIATLKEYIQRFVPEMYISANDAIFVTP